MKWFVSFVANRAMIALGGYLAYQALTGPDACHATRLAPDVSRIVAPFEQLTHALE